MQGSFVKVLQKNIFLYNINGKKVCKLKLSSFFLVWRMVSKRNDITFLTTLLREKDDYTSTFHKNQ